MLLSFFFCELTGLSWICGKTKTPTYLAIKEIEDAYRVDSFQFQKKKYISTALCEGN